MTRDEQALITEFVTRVANGDPGQPQLPIDPEADAIIRALFVRNPAAAYRMTLLSIAQMRALQAAQAELAAPRPGFWQRLFGGGPPAYPQQPPANYGGGMQGGGMFGGGFGSALGTGLGLGAGVALGEDLMRDVFGGGDRGGYDQGGYDQGGYDQSNFDSGSFDDPNNNDFI
jgi:hypothetical protein